MILRSRVFFDEPLEILLTINGLTSGSSLEIRDSQTSWWIALKFVRDELKLEWLISKGSW